VTTTTGGVACLPESLMVAETLEGVYIVVGSRPEGRKLQPKRHTQMPSGV
jgi:hypothetical protein